MFSKGSVILLVASMLLLSAAVAEQSEPCTVGLRDESKGVHVTVEACRDVGIFSIGGLSNEGRWEKLTYFYPRPWKGTFLSVDVDGKVYVNSIESQEGLFMDEYLVRGPEVDGGVIVTSWRLPGDIEVEQRFNLVDEGVMLTVMVANRGSLCVDAGVRLHLDTMLGENDGAPIYIPGDGLKSTEAEYYGKSLDFRYWKAYNTVDNPSLIATGILNDQSYPDRVIIANWKKSIHSSWDYTINPDTSILGDSAVILYYDIGRIDPGQEKTITTRYVNGEVILPVSKGYFGIAEIIPDKIDSIYCPNSAAVIKVDVLSRETGNEGKLSLEIRDEEENIVYTREEYTGLMGEDEVRDIPFRWQTPRNISPTYFDVLAVLYDMGGKELDRKETQVLVDYTACKPSQDLIMGWVDLIMDWLLFIIPLALIFLAGASFIIIRQYSRLGKVEIIKEKDGDTVKVTVWNKKRRGIENCVIVDRILEGAEVDILTSGVERKDTELIQYVGTLEGGDKAILEYRIKAVEFLPPAVVRWDFGERVSS